MATWPAELPKPLLSGYQGDVGKSTIRTDMDSGPARQRLRFEDNPDDLSIAWKFSAAEMVIFKEFWKTTLHRGTDWFLMDLHRGDGLVGYEVRFIAGNYQDQALPGLNWQVTARLEVRDI